MNNFPPLISIITVCLNSAELIEQTIQSVISQTYPHKEYIIIDGGSTDATVEIIQKYQSHLAYWRSRPDRGLAHAFNLGFEHSQGDWIIYINSDDFFLEPTVLEKMVPHLQAHDQSDVVIGQIILMSRQKNPQPLFIHGNSWQWQTFRRSFSLPHQAAFTHRNFFDQMGPFDESFKITVDYEFFLRAGKDLRCPYIPIPVSGMRIGGKHLQNFLKTLREAQRAQLKNGTLSIWFSWFNLYCLFTYRFLIDFAHKRLAQFENIIIGPDGTIKNNSQSNAFRVLKKIWGYLRSIFQRILSELSET